MQVPENDLDDRWHCAAAGANGALIAVEGNTTSTIESAIASVQCSKIVTGIARPYRVLPLEGFHNPATDVLRFDRPLVDIQVLN